MRIRLNLRYASAAPQEHVHLWIVESAMAGYSHFEQNREYGGQTKFMKRTRRRANK